MITIPAQHITFLGSIISNMRRVKSPMLPFSAATKMQLAGVPLEVALAVVRASRMH